jgi:hypothetical protein
VSLWAGAGVFAGPGSTIRSNTISDGALGFVSTLTVAIGILCFDGCNVLDNVVRNGPTPLDLLANSNSRYSRNVFSLYTNPPTGGVSAGDNLCNGVSC